jgi:hypothetical protein
VKRHATYRVLVPDHGVRRLPTTVRFARDTIASSRVLGRGVGFLARDETWRDQHRDGRKEKLKDNLRRMMLYRKGLLRLPDERRDCEHIVV